MAETDIGSAVSSDLSGTVIDYSVDSETTDAHSESKETKWTNSDWSQQFGYYTNIPELMAVIDAKATWTVGRGFLAANEETTMLLDTITGFGKDTFNTIIENMIRTYHIGGDSYAEIIRDNEGILINIKPLDTGIVSIIVNKQGKIIRYEQNSKVKGPNKKFKPEEILHFTRNRVADQIHGTSMITALKDTILRINEAKSDWKRVLHRNIDPLWIFHLDTDDEAKIAAFKAKHDNARGKGENMYIPKGAVVPELVSTAQNATLSPLAWIEAETNRFYEAAGVPKIIVGGTGGITEAAVKIAYLAFEQTIREEQLFIQEQILAQLNLELEFTLPASLENELISDNNKDGEPTAAQPNDTTTELEGNK